MKLTSRLLHGTASAGHSSTYISLYLYQPTYILHEQSLTPLPLSTRLAQPSGIRSPAFCQKHLTFFDVKRRAGPRFRHHPLWRFRLGGFLIYTSDIYIASPVK